MFVLVCQVGSVADEMVIGKQEGCRFDTRPDIMRQAERERERERDRRTGREILGCGAQCSKSCSNCYLDRFTKD